MCYLAGCPDAGLPAAAMPKQVVLEAHAHCVQGEEVLDRKGFTSWELTQGLAHCPACKSEITPTTCGFWRCRQAPHMLLSVLAQQAQS